MMVDREARSVVKNNFVFIPDADVEGVVSNVEVVDDFVCLTVKHYFGVNAYEDSVSMNGNSVIQVNVFN